MKIRKITTTVHLTLTLGINESMISKACGILVVSLEYDSAVNVMFPLSLQPTATAAAMEVRFRGA